MECFAKQTLGGFIATLRHFPSAQNLLEPMPQIEYISVAAINFTQRRLFFAHPETTVQEVSPRS